MGKIWEYRRPFTRVNPPSYNESRQPPDGVSTNPDLRNTFWCGCRVPDEGPPGTGPFANIRRKLMATVPSWVPVDYVVRARAGGDRHNRAEDIYEVEGTLTRSFQTWTDFPLYQWHRWYDWNFHVIPDKGYQYLAGRGNTPSKTRAGFRDTEQRVTDVTALECEMDAGALLQGTRGPREAPRLPYGHGAMGPMFVSDWAWPMTDEHIWVAGRWVYDCGHPVEGRNRTELHPVLAVASARWEGVKFDENPYYVPAIQFMFFSSRVGGYYNFVSIKRDYEFIVDLPRIKRDPLTARVGHTTTFPLNTITLRGTYLLKKFEYDRFSVAGAEEVVTPVVEPIPTKDPTVPPEQVRVKIPLSSASGDPEAYGVLISLGWFDPEGVEARKLKKCVITFHDAHKGTVNHNTGAERWLVKVGVNGRWFSRFMEDVHDNTVVSLQEKNYTIYLAEGPNDAESDKLIISAHGAALQRVERVMELQAERAPFEGRPDRMLRVAFADDPDHPRPITYKDHVDSGILDVQRAIAPAIYDRMSETRGTENESLGVIDPGHKQRGSDSDNPVSIRGFKGKKELEYTALFTSEVDRTAELKEDTDRIDYRLHATLVVTPYPD
jgi:hypothetical protein